MAKFKEEWRQIEGYPEYSVSNLGRVKKRLIKKLTVNNGGYQIVGMTGENGKENFKVHRLVVEAFIGKLEKPQIVKHLDGKLTNNRVDNLVVTSRSEITKADVEFIRSNAKKLGGSMNNAQLARKFNVSTVAIFKIVNGQTRKGEKA